MMNKNIFTIPNIITAIRMVIIIFAAMFLLNYDNINAFILYLSAALTDFLDGLLARALNQTTSLGKILDPIADKLMIISAVFILTLQHRMPVWYLLVLVFCSLFNLIGGLVLIKKYKIIPSAILIGKVAAAFAMATFLLNMVDYSYIEYLYYTSTALLVVSMVWYTKHSLKLIK